MNFSSVLSWGYRYGKFVIWNLDVNSWQNGQNPQLYLLLKSVRQLPSWKPLLKIGNSFLTNVTSSAIINIFQWGKWKDYLWEPTWFCISSRGISREYFFVCFCFWKLPLTTFPSSPRVTLAQTLLDAKVSLKFSNLQTLHSFYFTLFSHILPFNFVLCVI